MAVEVVVEVVVDQAVDAEIAEMKEVGGVVWVLELQWNWCIGSHDPFQWESKAGYCC